MTRWCGFCQDYREGVHPHGDAVVPSLWDAVEQEHERLMTPDHAPNRVRANDYATSKAGAVSVSFRAGSQKARLLDAYRRATDGLTDEEAAAIAGLPERSCYWKRCNELRDAGLIETTGQERPGLAGVPRIVCRVSE